MFIRVEHETERLKGTDQEERIEPFVLNLDNRQQRGDENIKTAVDDIRKRHFFLFFP